MDSLGPGGHFGFTTDKERSIKTFMIEVLHRIMASGGIKLGF